MSYPEPAGRIGNEPYREQPCDVIERDKPEIARAIDELRSVVDRYDNLVGRLADKLNGVVVPASPINSGSKEEPGYRTGLAMAINEIRCKLRDITDGLESMYERIEL